MRRREFIAGIGSAAAWPLAATAQTPERIIGVLGVGDENDLGLKLGYSSFTKALADLGWTEGRNVRVDLRWYGDDSNRGRARAQELVGLQPDIVLTSSTLAIVALQRETRTIPIVFANGAIPSPAVSSRGSTARVGTSPASATWKPRCHPRSRIKTLNLLNVLHEAELA